VLRAAEQNLVPQANALVNPLVDVIVGEQLLLIEPAADAATLEFVVQMPRKWLVGMAVADETREELDRFVQERWQIVDELVGETAASEEGEREPTRVCKCLMVDNTRPIM
jgi:hypothetical protein